MTANTGLPFVRAAGDSALMQLHGAWQERAASCAAIYVSILTQFPRKYIMDRRVKSKFSPNARMERGNFR